MCVVESLVLFLFVVVVAVLIIICYLILKQKLHYKLRLIIIATFFALYNQ